MADDGNTPSTFPGTGELSPTNKDKHIPYLKDGPYICPRKNKEILFLGHEYAHASAESNTLRRLERKWESRYSYRVAHDMPS
jgi:hypothetical protein